MPCKLMLQSDELWLSNAIFMIAKHFSLKDYKNLIYRKI